MPTNLNRGEIAIIGVNAEDTNNPDKDTISFILLAPITTGTVIYFTDRSWNGTVFANASADENTFTYTAGSDIAAGTVITITTAQLNAAGIDLADSGETIYVYQGAINAPTTFLFAIDIADGNTTFNGNLTNTGLVAGVSAVAVEEDNISWAGRGHNNNDASMMQSITDHTDWVGNDNSMQYSHTGSMYNAPDQQLWVAGSGGGEALMRFGRDGASLVAEDTVHLLQNTSNDGDATTFTNRVWHPMDIAFDTVGNKVFVADSDGNGHNRIVQYNISDYLANPGNPQNGTILYKDTLTGVGIVALQLDIPRGLVYFGADTHLYRVDYNTANQTPEIVAHLGTNVFVQDFVMDINFATGNATAYIVNSSFQAVFGVDNVNRNFLYQVTGITPTSTTPAATVNATQMEMDINDTEQGGVASANADPQAFPKEFGIIKGIDIDPETKVLFFTTAAWAADHDNNAGTAAQTQWGGVWSYATVSNAAGAYTNIWRQDGTNASTGFMYYIEVDTVNNRYYFSDQTGNTNAADDQAIWVDSLSAGGPAPTLFSYAANIQGLGPLGLDMQNAPTLTGSGNLSLAVTEGSSAPHSGETARVDVFPTLTAADVDTADGGDELRGAIVRVGDGFVYEASSTAFGHTGTLDYLRIDGNLSGTVSGGSGITYSYDVTTGMMTLSGVATTAEYVAAINLITFSTSGDNVTGNGNGTTRTISASVFDGLLYSDEVSAFVAVTGINDAPVNTIATGTFNFTEDSLGNVGGNPNPPPAVANAITGISIADADADATTENFTVTLSVAHGTLTIRTNVTGGLAAGDVVGNGTSTLTLTGTQTEINLTLAAVNGAAQANGLVYTPTLDWHGADTLTIVTNDQGNNGNDPNTVGDDGVSEADTDTITINSTAGVDIANDTVNAAEDASATLNLDLLANDTFENSDRSITAVTQGTHGTVAINTNGTPQTTDDFVQYTQIADYNGTDSFTYTVTSGGATETATVTVNLSAVVDIANDAATVDEDSGATTIDVLGLDTFENSGRVITAVGTAANGTVAIVDGPDADGIMDYVTYTPNADYYGTDSFTYTVTSGGRTEQATVNMTVTAVPDAVADSTTILEDAGTTTIDVLDNDTFESSGATITAVTQGTNGFVAINNNGTAGDPSDDYVTYRPRGDFNGADSFTYTVTSGGVTETQTVSVTVTAVNDTPSVSITAPFTPTGAHAVVNTTTTGSQANAATAGLVGGGYVVAWSGNGTGDSNGVFVQRYNAAGAVQGGEVLINSTTTNGQINPAVAALSAAEGGGYVVVWQGEGPGDTVGIFAQRFEADGDPLGVETLVNTTVANNQITPAVTALEGGGYVVTWSGNGTGDAGGVFAQRFDSAGNAQGGEVRVNTTVTGAQDSPSVAALSGGGGYVVTWQGSGPGDSTGVFAQRYDSSGVAQGGEVLVNTTLAGTQGVPSVAGLPGGGYVVVWSGNGASDSSDDGTFSQRYDASGNPVGSEERVAITTLANQMVPSVAALPGGYAVSWFGTGPGDSWGIFTRTFDEAGVPLSGEVWTNAPGAGSDQPQSPSVASLSDGGFVVAWHTGEVHARQFAPVAGTFTATEQTALDLKNTISVGDVDSGSATVTATLSVGYGILNVTAGSSGATVSGGNGTGTVTVTGTVAQIQALLRTDANSTITYTPNTDAPPASTMLTVTVNDGGATGQDPLLTGDADDEEGSTDATIFITAVNDAPTLSDAVVALAAQNEDDPAPVGAVGTLVSDLVDLASVVGGLDNVTDVDSSSIGIALTGTNETDGVWWYSTDGGANWAQVSSVAPNGALLLAGDDRLYFVPGLGFDGTIAEAITFRAWDQSAGTAGTYVDTTTNGGSTPYSTATDTASLTVVGGNSAPVVDLDGTDPAVNYSTSYTEGGAAAVLGDTITVTDADSDDITSAVVTITDPRTGDQIAFDPLPGGWTLVESTGVGGEKIYTITGTGTAAEYSTVLNTARFSSTSDNPDAGGTDATRTIQVTVSDAAGTSSPAETTIGIVAQNDPLEIEAADTDVQGTEDEDLVFSSGNSNLIAIDDPDGALLTVTLTVTNGTLTLSQTTNLNITAGADGSETMTFEGLASDINAALAGLIYRGDLNYQGTDTLAISVGDGVDSDSENIAITLSDDGKIDGTPGGDDIVGTPQPDYILGYGSDDDIDGAESNDIIDGGAGADNMSGGLGNDTYYVDNAGDLTNENPGEGNDAVSSTIDWMLQPNTENLRLLGTGDIDGTGNSLANVIIGNAGVNTLDGGEGADTLNGMGGDDIMIGGIGNDTFFVDSAGDQTIENAGEGIDTVRSTVAWTLSANVENLMLIGNAAINGLGNGLSNTMSGNSAFNILSGAGGNDTLSGGAGPDQLIGGTGDDVYVVDDDGDDVVENMNQGNDHVLAAISYTLAANVEKVTLTGTGDINAVGNGLDNVMIGNAGINSLTGGGGHDSLNGGAGADTMAGGTGNDLYIVDNVNDDVVENLNEGTDSVQSSITYVLGDNIEYLFLSGTGNIDGTGNGLANSIEGNGGNNVIDGGAGADMMRGHDGNDTYVVDNAGDRAVELSAAGGTDTVLSSVHFNLGAHVENLTLTGTGNIRGNGNSLANVITGNVGNNTLNGLGGADTMIGGMGNDIYFVDHVSDMVVEGAGEGIDTVHAAISHTLADHADYLYLSGTGNINGTGNGLDNTMEGNAGNNVLDGGAGADFMRGGAGNDTYVVDNALDKAVELNAAGGTDTVQSSVTFILAGHLENLTLTGAGNINGTGNTLANTITGNSGNNVLRGNVGADALTGGAGTDTFIYGLVADSDATNGIDTILDFFSGDKIDLSAIDANTGAFGNQAFTLIDGAAFGNVAGQLRVEDKGGYWEIQGDTDGDGDADLVINLVLADADPITSSDFML